MGLFKNIRGLMKDAKALQAQTPKTSMTDLVGQASSAVRDASAQMDSAKNLQANGRLTNGIVQAARPTQMRMNHMPVIEIEVVADERTVSFSQPIHELYLARLTPGAEVHLLVDDADANVGQLVFEGSN